MPTVVIADDSPTLRRIVSTVLEREGYTVVQAEDGVEAVQLVFRHMPDAVVLDVQMPRVSGYVTARLLKDDWRTADIPILLLTSLDAASDRYWGAQAGADRFLTKDFEAPQLVEAVHEVLSAADAARATCSTASSLSRRGRLRSLRSLPECMGSKRRLPRCSTFSAEWSTTTWRPS
jgi:CheY-like chemotaxis protein